MTDTHNPDSDDFFDALGLRDTPPSLSEIMKRFSVKDIEDTLSSALTDLIKERVSIRIQQIEYGTGEMFKGVSISNIAIRPGSHLTDN